ncbi:MULTISPECIES: DUF1840 domain-containing protein [Rheinheimera]|uniref:DUF1840 domain-containing protein n=1 Tax=Rheinheimera marina TaxID=1774958 RepID=A0ABV9JGU8_9GAMM
MLVTFYSKDSASITMFGQVAVQLLQMMGHSGKVPGAFYAEDVAACLARLQQQLQHWQDENSAAKIDDESDAPVSLRQRAVPLIELLQRAVQGGNNVSWD